MTLALGDVLSTICTLPSCGLTRCAHTTGQRPIVFSRGVARVHYTARPLPTPDKSGRGRHRRLGRLFR